MFPEHREILAAVAPGPGPHLLTGPIYIEDAEPRRRAEVDILDVALRQNWGYNSSRRWPARCRTISPSMRLQHPARPRAAGTASCRGA